MTRNTKLLHSVLFTVYRFREFFAKPWVFLPCIVISRIFFVEMFTLSGQFSEWGMLKKVVLGVRGIRREISWIIRQVISFACHRSQPSSTGRLVECSNLIMSCDIIPWLCSVTSLDYVVWHPFPSTTAGTHQHVPCVSWTFRLLDLTEELFPWRRVLQELVLPQLE